MTTMHDSPDQRNATPTGTSGSIVLKGFLGHTQQQQNWCWAAVCVTVTNYFSTPSEWLRQCDVVNMAFQTKDCCMSPGRYDIPRSVQGALERAGHLNRQIPGAADAMGGFAVIAHEVGTLRHPIAVRNRISGGGDHVVVICGLREQTQSLLVWNPTGYYLRTTLANWSHDLGDWTNTYLTT